MNLIAIDIGNRNIKIALYLDDSEKLLKTADETAGDIEAELTDILVECWDQVPLVEGATEPVKDCVLVASSVKPVTVPDSSEAACCRSLTSIPDSRA